VFRTVSGTERRGERARKGAKEESKTREVKERDREGVQRSRKEKRKKQGLTQAATPLTLVK
jgi:hypothetical protein